MDGGCLRADDSSYALCTKMAHLILECRNKFAWCQKSPVDPWEDFQKQLWPTKLSVKQRESTKWATMLVPKRSTTSSCRRTSNFAPIAKNKICTFNVIWLIILIRPRHGKWKRTKSLPGESTRKSSCMQNARWFSNRQLPTISWRFRAFESYAGE